MLRNIVRAVAFFAACAMLASTVRGQVVLYPDNTPQTGPFPTAAVTAQAAVAPGTVKQIGNYVMIGWNDLGMHCISPRFSEICILPPYNNLHAIVIRKGGEEPRIVTSGFTISYKLDNNQTVARKTDFWTYVNALFGRSIKPGIGLTGNGLSGKMGVAGGHFVATGVPALPYNDQLIWNPFQTATLTATLNGSTAGITSIVVPVSDEMHCSRCHKTGGMAQKGLTASTTEQYILKLHDKLQGTHLMNQRPVLCAKCHSDNALGVAGVKGVGSLSLVMHNKHSKIPTQPQCYDCHPGVNTQCNRSAIPAMGPLGTNPRCDLCHGNLTKMASALRGGRNPWITEPTCAQCHGASYSTGTTLYRNARGHGGVFCITCHGSPHAWWPSLQAPDNAQQRALQHNVKAIGYNGCSVCHTDGRAGKMPPHQED